MALHWDITACNLDKEWQKENWPAIESLIFLTMVIDVGKITSDNLEMVEFRLRAYSMISEVKVDDVLSILPKMVGLSVNVHTTKPKEYEKRLLEMLVREVNLRMLWAKREKAQ